MYISKNYCFFSNSTFLWSKNQIFIVISLGVINIWICWVESIPLWAIDRKILRGRDRVKTRNNIWWYAADVESSRTSLASRTSSENTFWSHWTWHWHQGQLLGLEASSPRKLPCLRLKNSTIFWTVEILLENAKNCAEN